MLRMKNGKEPLRSTPADVVNTNRFTLRGVAAIRFWLEIQSVCSGPLSPSHLQPRQAQQLWTTVLHLKPDMAL